MAWRPGCACSRPMARRAASHPFGSLEHPTRVFERDQPGGFAKRAPADLTVLLRRNVSHETHQEQPNLHALSVPALELDSAEVVCRAGIHPGFLGHFPS